MKPILFLAEFFPPPQHSGTLRSDAFVRHLPEFGVKPIVLTSAEAKNRAEILGINFTDTPASEMESSVYRIPWHNSNDSQKSSFLNLGTRIPYMNSLLRAKRRKKIIERVSGEALNLIRKFNCKAIYATSGPPEALIIAMHLSDACGIPFVVDIRDPWSYQPTLPYRHYIDFIAERNLERKVLSAASRVVVTARATADLLVREINIPSNRIVVIENGYDDEDFADIPTSRDRNSVFKICHAGQFTPTITNKQKSVKTSIKKLLGLDFDPLRTDGTTRSLHLMLSVIENLLAKHPSLVGRIEVILAGCDASAFTKLSAGKPKLNCITALPRVDAQKAAKICTESDLLLLLQTSTFLRREPYCVAIAAKLYTYLRTGRRILISSQGNEMSDIVQKYDAGTCVPEGNIDQIVSAIKDEFDRWETRDETRVEMRTCPELSRRERTSALANVILSSIQHSK